MPIIKYEFCIATRRTGSEVKDVVEIELDDDLTEEEIESKVGEAYIEWLCEHNYGYFKKFSD